MNVACKWILAVALAMGLADCAPKVPIQPPETRVEPAVAGGWRSATPDQDARAAADFAAGALNRPGVTVKQVDAVETQVVAGLNYRLDMTLSDGSRWRVVVYRNLQGGFSLTSSSAL